MPNFDKIEGTLVYVQVQESVKAYVKPGTPKKPDEWKASVVLTDEDFVDELEEYGKSLDTLLSIKKVKSSTFEETYKCDLPEGAGKNVWILTLRKSVELGKTGKPVPEIFRPRVFHKVKNTHVDITYEKLVGNGSYGVISIDKFERDSGGASLYLKNILVTDLKEYVRTESSYTAGSEFEDGNEEAEDKKPEAKKQEPKQEAPKKPKAPAKKEAKDSEEDEEFPFD
jgi:hypothetical protein